MSSLCSQGRPGTLGEVGTSGQDGPRGVLGPSGPKGEKGHLGLKGPSGPKGDKVGASDLYVGCNLFFPLNVIRSLSGHLVNPLKPMGVLVLGQTFRSKETLAQKISAVPESIISVLFL